MSSVADIRSTSPRRAIGWSSAIPTRIRSAVIIRINPRDLASYIEPVEDPALSRPGVIHLCRWPPTLVGDVVGNEFPRPRDGAMGSRVVARTRRNRPLHGWILAARSVTIGLPMKRALITGITGQDGSYLA